MLNYWEGFSPIVEGFSSGVTAARNRDRKLLSFQRDELVGRLVVAGRLRRSAFGVPVRDL
jgi:hypothetical protein